MKKITKENQKELLGGIQTWQCFGSGHKWGMLLYSNTLYSHFKKWLSHNPKYCGNI